MDKFVRKHTCDFLLLYTKQVELALGELTGHLDPLLSLSIDFGIIPSHLNTFNTSIKSCFMNSNNSMAESLKQINKNWRKDPRYTCRKANGN